MRKKQYLVVAVLGVMLVCSGCKKSDSITLEQYSQYKEIDTLDYVELGEYKEIKVSQDTIEVSQLEVDQKIAKELYDHGSYVDTNNLSVTVGCQITISMSGYMDGKQNDGFTQDEFTFVYGYDEYVMDGFTAYLEGMYQGETAVFDLVVPGTFSEPALVGKTVNFQVTLNNVQSYDTPELNEEFVKKVAGVTSIEEYREYLIPVIQEEKMNAIKKDMRSGIWKIVSDRSSVVAYPEGAIESQESEIREKLEIYATIQGMELEDYVHNFFGVTFDEYVKLAVKQELLLDAIGRAEKIALTMEEYEEGVATYAARYGYNDVNTMVTVLGEEKVKEALLWDKVMDYLVQQAVIEEA